MMEETDIVNEILCLLDGWKLDTDITTGHLTDMDYNKKISHDEVMHFYNVAYNYALTYLQVSEFPTQTITQIIEDEPVETTDLLPTIYTALFFWSAGLLWEKYNVRTDNQLDEDNPYGYGDKLIIQAKEMLKPIKSYNFYAY